VHCLKNRTCRDSSDKIGKACSLGGDRDGQSLGSVIMSILFTHSQPYSHKRIGNRPECEQVGKNPIGCIAMAA
jgi:hypothetical protein